MCAACATRRRAPARAARPARCAHRQKFTESVVPEIGLGPPTVVVSGPAFLACLLLAARSLCLSRRAASSLAPYFFWLRPALRAFTSLARREPRRNGRTAVVQASSRAARCR